MTTSRKIGRKPVLSRATLLPDRRSGSSDGLGRLSYIVSGHALRRPRCIRHVAVWMACLACLIPQPSVLGGTLNQPTKPPSVADDVIVDVALKGGGTVTGRVVDVRGAAVASAVVSIRQSGREVSRTLSDEEGRYVVNNLRGGVYRIVVAGDARVFRFWAINTAPPLAGETAISVVGNTVVCRRRGVTNTPLAENVFAAIAAAIGRPISPGNDDKLPAGL